MGTLNRFLLFIVAFSAINTLLAQEPTLPVFDSLVWSDEFDGNGAINTNTWYHQTQLPNGDSWYNGEIQHYTNRVENTSVSGGTLKIIARSESFTDQGVTKNHTSARLNSKFAFTYGRVEIRAKLPDQLGTWPALWLLGKNINEDGAYWDNLGLGSTPWPQCGEIDIMEHWADNPNFVQSAIHTPSSFGGTINKGGQTVSSVGENFHIYTMDWYEDRLVFAVDGTVHYTYQPDVRDDNTWPFNKEQYILMNIAILPSISAEFVQDEMEVDYVRIYQERKAMEQDEDPIVTGIDEPLNELRLHPNPVQDYLKLPMEGDGQEVFYEILTLDGKGAKAGKIRLSSNQFRLFGLGGLPAGSYVIRLKSGDRHMAYRFIKNQ